MKVSLSVSTGVIIGSASVLLISFGNPGISGLSIVGHLRDIAGSLGLHQAAAYQYMRPEILGLILGAYGAAKVTGEYSTGRKQAGIHFLLGVFMMIGALAFLGDPLQAVLRFAAGDMNALIGIAGYICGIRSGMVFQKKDATVDQAILQEPGKNKVRRVIPCVIALGLLVAVLAKASFLHASTRGPGAYHAPIAMSLLVGMISGVLAQRTRMCFAAGVQRYIEKRDTYLVTLFEVLFLTALLGNLYFGIFNFSFPGQPQAHFVYLWSFLGAFTAGLAAVFAGGDPLRQLIMCGEGNSDAAFCVLGMVAGIGLTYSLNSATTASGLPVAGQLLVSGCLLVVLCIGWCFRERLFKIKETL